ncbi:hypothetical protein DL93DRAFT_1292143 [Clavulina sp. PMI_390]|nr:hypothetical protein DL93DRAFT_1292143 [Clavulina sp. PMI_390]
MSAAHAGSGEEASSSRLIRSAPRRVTADSPTPISAPSTVSRGLSFTGLKNALANLVFSGAADKSVPSPSEESSVRAGKRKRESTPEPSPSSRRAADATLSTSRASKRRSQAPQSSAGSDGDESGGDDGSDESDDEDDAPRRVLRPRLTQTASSSTSQAPQSNHISPTAPHIRSLNALKLQTQRKKPQWKGWISLPNGSCDNCYGIHEELKDCEPEPDQLLICQRCTRHFNVYGEKWPGRSKEVFTDLSSTSSDDESSDSNGSSSGESEQAVTFRSSRLLKRALAEKAKAKAEGRANTLSVATASTRQAMLDDRARKANARKRAKAAALEQSRSISASEDNSRQSPSPAPPSKVAAPRKSAVVAVSSVSKTNQKITISKGRVSVASTTVTVSAAAAAATIRGRKSVGGTSASGTPGKSGGRENTRAMRAEARRIARDNPDLDIEDAKRAAAAGVMRSGRTRGVEKEEKMPVTGPPIATISKRKRAASTSEEDEDTKKRPRGRPRKHPYADDDDEDGEEDEDEDLDASVDVTARSTGKASATSTPTVRLTVKRNGKPLYGAAKASAAKKAAMAALAATSTPESKKPKLEFTTRSGGRWGAQSPDRSSSPAGSHSSARSSRSDTRGAEEDADGEDDNEKEGGSPSTMRVQAFSLKPSPAVYAYKRQQVLSEQAPDQLRYSLPESTGSTPAPPTVVEEGSSPAGRPQMEDVFTSDGSTDSAKLVQAQLESGLAEDGEEVVQLEITQITTDSSTFTLTIDPAEVETTVTASGSESPNSRDTPLGTSVPPSISSASTAPSSKSAGTPKLLEDALTSATSPVMSLAARANSNPRTYQTSLSARKRDGF